MAPQLPTAGVAIKLSADDPFGAHRRARGQRYAFPALTSRLQRPDPFTEKSTVWILELFKQPKGGIPMKNRRGVIPLRYIQLTQYN